MKHVTTCAPPQYDNDPVSLRNDRERLRTLIKSVDNDLEIIALEDNREEYVTGGGDETEKEEVERHNFYILNKKSLEYEAQLRKLIAEGSERFSLIRRNHTFVVQHGSMASYDAREMTLAVQRIAFVKPLCDTNTARKANKRQGLLYRFGQLFLAGFICYAVWMLWIIVSTAMASLLGDTGPQARTNSL